MGRWEMLERNPLRGDVWSHRITSGPSACHQQLNNLHHLSHTHRITITYIRPQAFYEHTHLQRADTLKNPLTRSEVLLQDETVNFQSYFKKIMNGCRMFTHNKWTNEAHSVILRDTLKTWFGSNTKLSKDFLTRFFFLSGFFPLLVFLLLWPAVSLSLSCFSATFKSQSVGKNYYLPIFEKPRRFLEVFKVFPKSWKTL